MTVDNTPMLTNVGYVATPHLSLPNIYFISKLILNRPFISKLCVSSNYLVIFSSFFLLCAGSTISKADGRGRKKRGLYILNELKVLVIVTTSVNVSSFHLSIFFLLVFIYNIII